MTHLSRQLVPIHVQKARKLSFLYSGDCSLHRLGAMAQHKLQRNAARVAALFTLRLYITLHGVNVLRYCNIKNLLAQYEK